MIRGSTRLAAVIGDPVRHSASPRIHNAAFAALELDWAYVAFEVADGDAGAALNAMRVLGIDGLSVTMPHKAAVAAEVDDRTDAVARLGSCNCVVQENGRLVGHNTDGAGFVDAFEFETGSSLSDARVAVLGAGGAARAIVYALGTAGASRIDVINRSAEKANQAANLAATACVATMDAVADAEVIVNATSVGMGDSAASPVPATLLRPTQIVADIVYQPAETKLLREAALVGARTVGGIGMLVHQAAVAFELWTGREAPIVVMRDAVAAE